MSDASRIHLHHAESLEPLLDQLAAELRVAPADPFEREMVVVPTVGLADAAMAGLGHRLGVCTNVDFAYPGRFLSRALGRGADADPWRLPQLAWAVLEELTLDHTGVPGVDSNGVGWSLARHIADLFDRYSTQRPELIRAWAAFIGHSAPIDTDGAGGLLGADHQWQAHLWRRVRARLDVPSLAELLPHLGARISSGDLTPDLPSRLFVFGVGSLPPTMRAVLEAISTTRDVHVFLEHPSHTVWRRPVTGTLGELVTRETPGSVAEVSHPLLASWGRPSLEAQAVLRGNPAITEHELPTPSRTPATALHALQDAIRLDRVEPWPGLDLADGSLQVHTCHGTARQIEVLRDVLGHCFVDDPTLSPHEVIVVCPELEEFAPLIPAIFAQGNLPIPVRIGDRSLTVTEPVVEALMHALSMASGRTSLSEMIELVQFEPVRRRFGLELTSVETLTEWCAELGTRWGLDVHHRLERDIPTTITCGTWRSTLDQLLAGMAMSAPETRPVLGDVTPYDDLSTDDSVLVGALAELVMRLSDLHDHTNAAKPIDQWADILHQLVDDLVATPADEGWRIGRLHRDIAALVEHSSLTGGPCTLPITFADLRVLLLESLSETSGRVSLRSGAVTVTSTVPQHGVPARVICVLGLDDTGGRGNGFDGDDILGLRPCIGERHPRSERRQTLLDLVLDADEQLIITCNGHDLTTNKPIPLMVPLTELLDATMLTVPPEQRTSTSPVIVEHPRHGFDAKAFIPGAISPMVNGPFAFDPTMLAAAQARLHATLPPPLSWHVPAQPQHLVRLHDLARVFARPAEVLIKHRLQVRLPDDGDVPDDDIPFELSRLTATNFGAELLRARARHLPVDEIAHAARERGVMPPLELGAGIVAETLAEIDEIEKAAFALGVPLAGDGGIAIDLSVANGATQSIVVQGEVTGVHRNGDDATIVMITFSKHRPSRLLEVAVKLAAAACAEPSTVWRGVLVSRGDDAPESYTLTLRGDNAEARRAAAEQFLRMALEFYADSSTRPVPYLDRTSHAIWARSKSAQMKADFKRDLEYDEYAQLLWPDLDPLKHVDIFCSPEFGANEVAEHVWGTFADAVQLVAP